MWSRSYVAKIGWCILFSFACFPASVWAFPMIWNVPSANPYFVGREAMLDALQYRLEQGETLAGVSR